jgi:hypothetical protein
VKKELFAEKRTEKCCKRLQLKEEGPGSTVHYKRLPNKINMLGTQITDEQLTNKDSNLMVGA